MQGESGSGGQSLAHSTGHLSCGGFAAQVAGVQGGIGGDLIDGSHQALCGSSLTQVFE